VAATWFAEHAQPADAVRHMQAAGDWPAAARLLTDHALSLTLDGEAGTVRALLRSFPRRTGGDQPELAVVFAIAGLDQLRLDHAAAHLDIARSYAATIPSDRRCHLDMAIASLDLLLARLRGDFTAILERAGSLPVPVAGQSTAAIALAGDLRAIALLNLGVTEAWSMRLLEANNTCSRAPNSRGGSSGPTWKSPAVRSLASPRRSIRWRSPGGDPRRRSGWPPGMAGTARRSSPRRWPRSPAR
jgi:LuxR family maltose regulon positive regulatory protein